jgi:hypothetical protein
VILILKLGKTNNESVRSNTKGAWYCEWTYVWHFNGASMELTRCASGWSSCRMLVYFAEASNCDRGMRYIYCRWCNDNFENEARNNQEDNIYRSTMKRFFKQDKGYVCIAFVFQIGLIRRINWWIAQVWRRTTNQYTYSHLYINELWVHSKLLTLQLYNWKFYYTLDWLCKAATGSVRENLVGKRCNCRSTCDEVQKYLPL